MPRVSIQYVTLNNISRELIQIDVTTVETHGFSSKATVHPIEDGSNISDHVIKKARTLSLGGVISDTPITAISAPTESVDGVGGSPIRGSSKTQVSKTTSKIGSLILSEGSGKISKTAEEIFESMSEERLLLTIITGLKTYTNMVLEDFKVNINPRTASSIAFSATFREVIIAVSEVVEVPLEVIDEEVRDSASPKDNKGKLPANEAEGKVEEKGSSLLSKLKEAI